MSKGTMIVVCDCESTRGIKGYTARELKRVFIESAKVRLPAFIADADLSKLDDDAILLGTRKGSASLARLLDRGFLKEPVRAQGYSMKCMPNPANPNRFIFAVAGADDEGVLYALRDLEHYHMHLVRNKDGRIVIDPFERFEYPLIQFRGHWTWGCNMPDKPAWIENMSRWKLNELIHWDNHLPARAKEYVDFARERGVRIAWGFGWGWVPAWNFTIPDSFDHGKGNNVEMCPSSEFNLQFFRTEILRKVREEYAPTGCYGIYFQSFTECPKCECPRCSRRTMGELMLNFVNPIVDDIKREFPDMWISCGIHHNFGDFSFLRDLDPRCNLYWENCDAGTSVRGPNEDFGYINKSIPYGHGFGKDCPAEPEYTEDSLKEWMKNTAEQYTVPGGLESHYRYMQFMQKWGRRFLGKESEHRHASMVADHSVFCRRTPFPHVALAEAQWNPNCETKSTVEGILSFLGTLQAVQRTPEPETPLRDFGGKPAFLCPAEGQKVELEGHLE